MGHPSVITIGLEKKVRRSDSNLEQEGALKNGNLSFRKMQGSKDRSLLKLGLGGAFCYRHVADCIDVETRLSPLVVGWPWGLELTQEPDPDWTRTVDHSSMRRPRRRASSGGSRAPSRDFGDTPRPQEMSRLLHRWDRSEAFGSWWPCGRGQLTSSW